MRLIPLALLLAATTASAQITWHNLHFGQSHDAVTAEFNNQNLPSSTSQDGSVQLTADYELPLPGLRYPFPVIVTAHFDTNNALADLTLSLDLASARRYFPNIGSDDALLHFAAEHFTAALSGRYGAPLYSSSSCDAEPSQPSTFCIISWHGTNQTIELERSASPKGPRLLIRYQPLASDL